MTRLSLQEFVKFLHLDAASEKLINKALDDGYRIITIEKKWDADKGTHVLVALLGLPGDQIRKNKNGVFVYE